jgi:hypothetical protein
MPSNQKATHCWTANGVPSQFDLQMEQRNAGEWIIQATLTEGGCRMTAAAESETTESPAVLLAA